MKNILLIMLGLSTPLLAQQTPYKAFEVDKPAEPQGGMQFLDAFALVNLRKPVSAAAQGLTGRVIIEGVLEPDGRLSETKIMKSLRPDCDQEALRVFSLFKAWSPALKDGKPVRQQVIVPILFRSNPPFTYADGARISYFDKDSKLVADGSQEARFKQLSPVDSLGLPSGDVVVYKGSGDSWKEYNRLKFVRQELRQQTASTQRKYRFGYQSTPNQWHGEVYEIDERGTILRQQTFNEGRPTGTAFTYAPSGVLLVKEEHADSLIITTSWFPNGQIRQGQLTPKMNMWQPRQPEKIMSVWDSTGRQLVKDGNGQATFWNTTASKSDTNRQTAFIEKGALVNGFKQGTWTGRYNDGSYYYEEHYDEGICQGGKSVITGSDTLRYKTPMQQPEFAGGMQGLMRFLAQNLRYPADAQRARAQGRVFVSFVVCTDGTLCDYEVVKSVHPDLDREAVHVVEQMNGRWKPGVDRGQKVRVKYNLPINFALE